MVMIKTEAELSFREYREKQIVATDTGKPFGSIADLMIDPTQLKLAAIVISQNGAAQRKMIPFDQVTKWEEDALWVTSQNAVRGVNDPMNDQAWRSVDDQILDLEVMTANGKRLGEINDVLLNKNGQIAGFDISAAGPDLEIGHRLNDHISSEGKEKLQIGHHLDNASAGEHGLQVGHRLGEPVSTDNPDLQIGHQLGEYKPILVLTSAVISLGPDSMIVDTEKMAG